MKKLLIFGIFALLTVSFAGCSKSDTISQDDDLQGKNKVYKLSASGDKSPDTKALAVEDRNNRHYLVSTWSTSDKIYVHNRYEDDYSGILSPLSDGASAVLSGNIEGSFKVGDLLGFTCPGQSFIRDYRGQDGTLETIAQKYDYTFAEEYIKSIDGNNITLDKGLTFKNHQAIVMFTFVDPDNNPVYPTKVKLKAYIGASTSIITTVSGSRGELEVNIDQTVPHNNIYVAINMFKDTAEEFWLTASVGDAVEYRYVKTTPTKFEDGKYYEIKVKLSQKTVIPTLNDLKFNFNFQDNGSAWAKGGPVFVFFEGVTTGYYRSTDGQDEGTFIDLGGTSVSDLVKNGKATAVFLDCAEYLNSTNPVSYSDGSWVFNSSDENGFKGWNYSSANKVQYTYTTENVGGTETLSLNADFNLLPPPTSPVKIATDKANSVKFACNYLIPAGLASVGSDGSVNEVEGNAGDWINVIKGGGFACARLTTPAAFIPAIYKPESLVYYYFALQTELNGNYSYYHLLDNNGSRLEVSDSNLHCAHIGESAWIQVGPNHFVDLRGKTWWTTNLSSDRHSPLPHPWTTAELAWTPANQWDNDRISKSLSNATFDYNSELPNPFDWNAGEYVYQIISVCGIKGFVYGDLNDLSKFIFLPFANEDDFYFYCCVYPSSTTLRYNYNWHYWAKGNSILLYHKRNVLGTDDLHWAYNFTSTFYFPSHNDSFYPCYYGWDWDFQYGRGGVPDYALINNDNQQLHFPARPVKK